MVDPNPSEKMIYPSVERGASVSPVRRYLQSSGQLLQDRGVVLSVSERGVKFGVFESAVISTWQPESGRGAFPRPALAR